MEETSEGESLDGNRDLVRGDGVGQDMRELGQMEEDVMVRGYWRSYIRVVDPYWRYGIDDD